MTEELVSNQLSNSMLQLVHYRYEQVIEVNLTEKQCKVLWSKNNMSDSFYIDDLWESNKLYENEVKSFRKLRNVDYIKEKIEENSSICMRFRRREAKKVEWMQIEVVPAIDYSFDNVNVVMFIKSIDDSYGKEYKARKDAEKLARTDALTGYLNRLAFDRFCKSCKCTSMGVVFVDLNCLKEINDREGHEIGDMYIKKCCAKMNAAFSAYKKYRVGGDEFVVLAPDADFNEFAAAVYHFNVSINENLTSMPICSVGHTWSDARDLSISSLITNAEKKMYRCKESDYLRFNQDRRRNDRRHTI